MLVKINSKDLSPKCFRHVLRSKTNRYFPLKTKQHTSIINGFSTCQIKCFIAIRKFCFQPALCSSLASHMHKTHDGKINLCIKICCTPLFPLLHNFVSDCTFSHNEGRKGLHYLVHISYPYR